MREQPRPQTAGLSTQPKTRDAAGNSIAHYDEPLPDESDRAEVNAWLPRRLRDEQQAARATQDQ